MKAGFLLIVLAVINVFSTQKINLLSGDGGRIESEIKLVVPASLSDSMWNFLESKYIKQKKLLEIDSLFQSSLAEELFIDQYYDNEEKQLVRNYIGLRHRKRFVLSDSTNKKNGKELMQLKVHRAGEVNSLEYKFGIKHYENKNELLDSHPLLGIVKRSQRGELLDHMKDLDVNALNLFMTISIEQLKKRIYIHLGAKPYATISLDDVTATLNGKMYSFCELELELNEVNYTRADSTLRIDMEDLLNTIKIEIISTFPQIIQDQTPKYLKAAAELDY